MVHPLQNLPKKLFNEGDLTGKPHTPRFLEERVPPNLQVSDNRSNGCSFSPLLGDRSGYEWLSGRRAA